MKTLNLLVKNIRNSLINRSEYRRAREIVRKYENRESPYNSSEYKDGFLVPHEVVESRLTIFLKKSSHS